MKINRKIYQAQDLTMHFDYEAEEGINQDIKTLSLEMNYFIKNNLRLILLSDLQSISNFNHTQGLNVDYFNYKISLLYNHNFKIGG